MIFTKQYYWIKNTLKIFNVLSILEECGYKICIIVFPALTKLHRKKVVSAKCISVENLQSAESEYVST